MEPITKERKRQLSIDLILILVLSFLGLAGFGLLDQVINLNSFVADTSINIVWRVLVVAVFGQFATAGLGITVVCLIRKEKFRSFGLNTKNLLPTIVFSALCCVPEILFYWSQGTLLPWCPFRQVHTTAEVLSSAFPYNVLGMLITATAWGFFEGFNYVVIRDKISELWPSKYKWFDWGALICAIMCIIIHWMVGVTPDAILEMLATMILIYGMLIVRKVTGNAWGCVLIFCLYWNAV